MKGSVIQTPPRLRESAVRTESACSCLVRRGTGSAVLSGVHLASKGQMHCKHRDFTKYLEETHPLQC